MTVPARTIPLHIDGLPNDSVYNEPVLILHVIEIDGTPFDEGQIVTVIPYTRLVDRVLLGCQTPMQVPLFKPDIDLLEVLGLYSTSQTGRIVSRQHVLFTLQDGNPTVRHLAQRGDTSWVERATRLIPVRRENLRLEDRDVLILGNPSGRCVRIKVEFVAQPS